MSAAAPAVERGPITDLAIVRLADEGVPIKALVRVFHRPFGEVEGLLKDAKDDGRILALPAADWPKGTSRDLRIPTIAMGRGELPHWLVLGLKVAFDLSLQQASLLSLLIWRGQVSKGALHEAVSGDACPKIVDVIVCKCRRKLERHGIAIGTVWGWGYEMAPAHRQTARLIAEARAAEFAPERLAEAAQ